MRVTGRVKLWIKVISLVLVVSIDHNRLSSSHSPNKVAPSSSPPVIVSNIGPGEDVGLKQHSIPPSALKLVAYSVPPADTTS
ncbi:hypothetical protein ES703_72481 [subsurface metagenome]